MKFFKKKPKSSNKDATQLDRRRVYSYYTASSQQLNTSDRQVAGENLKSETRKRHLRILAKNWFYIIVGSVAGIALLFMMTLSREPQVIIGGPSYRPATTYYKFSLEAVNKTWLNMLKPTLDKTGIAKNLKATVPEISNVSVSTSFFGRRPVIRITTDKAMATFQQAGLKYILSDKGRILLPTNDASNIKAMVNIINGTGVSAQEGAQFITPDQAVAFNKLIFQSGAEGNSNISFEIPPQPHEILMRDSSEGNFYVRFILDSATIEQQYGAYVATLKQIGEQKPTEYIDARLADKVYVK